MKLSLAITIATLIAVGTVFAQAGSVGIFADPAGSSLYVLDIPPAGLKLYYVVHVFTPGATGVQYKATIPACMAGAIWLSDTNIFPVSVGNSQTGFSTGYGSCRAGSINVQIINVFGQGTSQDCCFWHVTADPGSTSGLIEAADCNFNVMYPTGGTAIVNPNPSCTTPVEDTTWGQVKALFAE